MPTQGTSRGRREEELLRHVAEIIVEVAPDGRVLYVSPPVERILGRTPEYFQGLSFLEIVVPEDRSPTLAGFQKVVETGDEPLVRFRAPRRDGVIIEFEATVRSFVDQTGRQRILATCRDLTDQSAQRSLDRRRNAHHRAVAESDARPIAIATSKGRLLFSNRRFREIFGSDISLMDLRNRISGESRIATGSAWHPWRQANANAKEKTGTSDFEYMHPDGTTSWFSSGWEVLPHNGPGRQYLLIYEDITRRKKIEHALRTLAGGIASAETTILLDRLGMVAEALEMDRLVLGLLEENQTRCLRVLAAWGEGAPQVGDSLVIADLPDETVAGGDICIHPTGVSQLMPAVSERVGRDFDSYAGLPVRGNDDRVIGVVGGYARRPIRDTDLVRSLLSSFGTHAAAALGAERAMAELQMNRRRFEALALQADDLLVELGSDGRITYVSSASQRLLGVAPEWATGRFLGDLTQPSDYVDLIRTHSTTPSSDPDSGVRVTQSRDAEGCLRWFESRGSAFTASDGSIRSLILVRDVTQKRQSDLARDLFYAVIQEGTDPVFVCEPDATLLFANEAAARLISAMPSDDARQRNFLEWVTAKDAERLRLDILPAITPSEPWSGEIKLLDARSGGRVATEATFMLFQGTGGASRTYLAVTLRDITKRRSAEESLRQSELRFSQAQKMEAVGRLAGGIAHDFNNLLTAIIGYSDLVLDELGDGHGARRDIEEILRAAERAGGLTRQLLAFSRRQVLQPESVDLNAIVADIDRMMRRLIGENIELVTVQNGELERIVADPGQIEQVIVNLVVNARDAMPRGGRIEIETANFATRMPLRTASGLLDAGRYVVMKVSDTGTGMDEATQAQIFEPFFTTKEPNQGTGLGLASAYGIVSQSGGKIDVESTPDLGTIFTIYLPVTARRVDPADPETLETHPGGRETILLLEDSDAVRHLVHRTLEKSGYSVLAAGTATDALRHCSRYQGPIDLLLADVVLPRTSGPEVARRALQLRPGLHVLFMSGFTDDTLVRHGLEPGTTELLEKPFTPGVLLSRVRKLLDGVVPGQDSFVFHVKHP